MFHISYAENHYLKETDCLAPLWYSLSKLCPHGGLRFGCILPSDPRGFRMSSCLLEMKQQFQLFRMKKVQRSFALKPAELTLNNGRFYFIYFLPQLMSFPHSVGGAFWEGGCGEEGLSPTVGLLGECHSCPRISPCFLPFSGMISTCKKKFFLIFKKITSRFQSSKENFMCNFGKTSVKLF